MRKIIKIALIANFAVTIVFLAISLFGGGEDINPLYPLIDTRLAKDFSAKKWGLIKSNMTKEEVIKLVGEPLSSVATPLSMSPPNTKLAMLYSGDAAWCCADYAWVMYVVYLDKDMKVIYAESGWRYD